jgi:DNA-binding transcriptional LysR family regulator
MNSLPLLLQAAMAGQGIALGYGLLTDDLLARGTLVRPLAASIRTTRSYHVLLSERRSSRQAIAFRDWLLQQCGQSNRRDGDP